MAGAALAVDPGFARFPHAGYDGQFYWGIASIRWRTGHVHSLLRQGVVQVWAPVCTDGFAWLSAQAGHAPCQARSSRSGSPRFSWQHDRGGSRIRPRPLRLGGTVRRAQSGTDQLGGARPRRTACDALLLGALAAYARDRRTLAWICLALVPLSKEPLLVVLARRRGVGAPRAPAATCRDIRDGGDSHPALVDLYANPPRRMVTSGDTALGEPLPAGAGRSSTATTPERGAPPR